MKNLKKTLSVLLAALMILSLFAMSAFAAGKITVTLRIEGIKACLYYGKVTLDNGSSVLDVLKQADKDSTALTVTVVDSQYGPYVSAINNESEKTFKGFDGWLYRVNGTEPQLSAAKEKVNAGDSVVFYYGDPYGVGMQYPVINTENLKEGKISFTSMDTTYDENWNPIVKENPVTGYTLTWGYENGKTVTLTPDENGVCTVPEEYRTNEAHCVQIERYAANGCPSVLRYAPDFTVGEKTTANILYELIARIKDFFNKVVEFFKNIFKK